MHIEPDTLERDEKSGQDDEVVAAVGNHACSGEAFDAFGTTETLDEVFIEFGDEETDKEDRQKDQNGADRKGFLFIDEEGFVDKAHC